ncbi:hypothetical protein PIB30_058414 [Stylosanthes scabra]|uniref:Uncharacterized protein n=1 Tax=Stylosanthes scabra TaxID=79078 RepID=A0ABU6TKI4_9FABA|nr:hypothetical protein [Stylosanthes scabra]
MAKGAPARVVIMTKAISRTPEDLNEVEIRVYSSAEDSAARRGRDIDDGARNNTKVGTSAKEKRTTSTVSGRTMSVTAEGITTLRSGELEYGSAAFFHSWPSLHREEARFVKKQQDEVVLDAGMAGGSIDRRSPWKDGDWLNRVELDGVASWLVQHGDNGY